MINLGELYEQSGKTFYTCLNFTFILLGVVIIFPAFDWIDLLRFIYKQSYNHSQLQSGNVSVFFVTFVAGAYLFEHLSKFFDEHVPPFITTDFYNFNELVTLRFFNLFGVMQKNGIQYPITKGIALSVQEALSIENQDSNVQRRLSILKIYLRFSGSYAGTFKLLCYLDLIVIIRSLFLFNINLSMYELFLFVLLYVLWRGATYWKRTLLWRILNNYWLSNSTADPKPNSLADRWFAEMIISNKKIFNQKEKVLMRKDIKNSSNIKFKRK